MPEMKPQVYLDDRPAEYFDQFHASARKGVGWTYTAARILVTIPTILLYRVAAIDAFGSYPSSTEISSSRRPLIPPFLLASANAANSPWRIPCPKAAEEPSSAATWPSRIRSFVTPSSARTGKGPSKVASTARTSPKVNRAKPMLDIQNRGGTRHAPQIVTLAFQIF